jgi:tRNA U34 5-methylaminomethyl-2-thiouridine-forming methyltransferase MnmC
LSGDYQIVPLAHGGHTLYSARYGEKLHPGLGPAAEAELLYVRQLNLRERLSAQRTEFVVWDVGLGAAANALAILRATRDLAGELRLVSFDDTDEPLAFALQHAAPLGYPVGFEPHLATLLRTRRADFAHGKLRVRWEFQLGDFPAWLEGRSVVRRVATDALAPKRSEPDAPHAICYDAFSPAKNPAMWTLPVFERLFQALDPGRPCALTTYSRSTMIRATLLLAGWTVGVGHATGRKEETTIAANVRALIAEPLEARWLERAARSDSAEPMREPRYARAPLAPATLAALRRRPQFSDSFTR